MDRKFQFLEELKKAFDYSEGFCELGRMKREQAMDEASKLKKELEKESRENYKNFLEQVVRNENLAPGLRTWATFELDRVDNDDVMCLRRQQTRKMREMREQITNSAVQASISAIISRSEYFGGKNQQSLTEDYTLSCKDNTKSDLN